MIILSNLVYENVMRDKKQITFLDMKKGDIIDIGRRYMFRVIKPPYLKTRLMGGVYEVKIVKIN